MLAVAGSTYGQQQEQWGSREGGTPAHVKACSVSWELVMEAKPGIKHSHPRGSSDKRERCRYAFSFLFSFPSLFWVLLFILFDILSELAFSCVSKPFSHPWQVLYRREIQAGAPQCSAFLQVQPQFCSGKCCGVSAQNVQVSFWAQWTIAELE